MEENLNDAEETPAGLIGIIKSRILGEKSSAATKIAMGFFGVVGAGAGYWLSDKYIVQQFANIPEWTMYTIYSVSTAAGGITFSQLARIPEIIIRSIYSEQKPEDQVGGATYSIGEKEIQEAEAEIARKAWKEKKQKPF